MDSLIKEGQVYILHQKFGKKWRWRKTWLVLYPASQNGVARLEMLDRPGSDERPHCRRQDKRVVRLSDCVSIGPAPAECCPRDDAAAFCVETTRRTHTFATDHQAASEWVEKMCQIAFPGAIGQLSSDSQKIPMAENVIYASREEVSDFWVCVRRTEASERCGLQGAHWLAADRESLVLKDMETRRILLAWPYRLLRRFGSDKDMFSIEAGRRCESGPGNFTFETKQSTKLLGAVKEAIQEQKALLKEQRESSPLLESVSQGLETRARDSGEGGGWMKGRSLPDPPSHSPRSCSPCRGPEADPAEGVYVDPLDVLRVPRPGSRGNQSEPVYSDVYNQVGALGGLEEQNGGASLEQACDRPEGQATPEPTPLYSQVFKQTPFLGRRLSSSDLRASNVVYDNLGEI